MGDLLRRQMMGQAGSSERAWEDGVPYPTSAYQPYSPNTYLLQTSGAEAAYNGWDATGFVDCEGASVLRYGLINDPRYCIFYDASKNFVINFARAGSTVVDGGQEVNVPTNAKFFRLSGTSTYVSGFLSGESTATPYL